MTGKKRDSVTCLMKAQSYFSDTQFQLLLFPKIIDKSFIPMEILVPLLAITMVFGIPISAILSNAYLKSKKLDLEKGGGLKKEDMLLLQKALKENEELRRRIENLEEIVTDPDMLRLHQTRDDFKKLK